MSTLERDHVVNERMAGSASSYWCSVVWLPLPLFLEPLSNGTWTLWSEQFPKHLQLPLYRNGSRSAATNPGPCVNFWFQIVNDLDQKELRRQLAFVFSEALSNIAFEGGIHAQKMVWLNRYVGRWNVLKTLIITERSVLWGAGWGCGGKAESCFSIRADPTLTI